MSQCARYASGRLFVDRLAIRTSLVLGGRATIVYDVLLPRDAMLARYSLCYGAVLHSLVASDAASDTDNCTSRQ